MRPPVRHVVHGVDFSGAADAGRRIWIATGVVSRERLRIVDLRRAADLSDWGPARVPSLAALRRFIAERPTCVFGLDFPFGLPLAVTSAERWEDFVTSFASSYADAEALRVRCLDTKRVTDRVCGAPFAPANIRLCKQTFFGIRDVLAPLVRDDRACVIPMQYRRRGRPWLVEICPAVTLARHGLRVPYKGAEERRREARSRIVAALGARGVVLPEAVRASAIEDDGGDALDAVIAAYATARALDARFAAPAPHCLLEGWIYA